VDDSSLTYLLAFAGNVGRKYQYKEDVYASSLVDLFVGKITNK
jgi:hypothetical protein